MTNPHDTARAHPRASRPARAATPIAFVQAIAHAYTLRQMNPAPALAQARIAPALLSDPAARITAAQMEAIYQTVRSYDNGGSKFVAGDVNGDGIADFTIATGASQAVLADFFL